MIIYKVTGKLPYTTFCSCEHCEGHTKTKKIDELVEASSERAAIINAIMGSDMEGAVNLEDEDDEDGWEELAEYLTVIEAPQDQAMSMLGMPTLFEEEPAP